MVEPALSMTGELADMMVANDLRAKPLRFSALKQMARSPSHCLHSLTHDWEPSLAMRIGSGVHSLLLGGAAVVKYTGKVRRGKDYDAWLATQPTGAIVLLSKDYDRVHRVADSVRAHPAANRVLFQPDTVYETTILWEQNGRARRTTPDARTKTHLVELKSCRNAEPEKFRWDAIRMGYHAQLAEQSLAMECENGYAPKDVYCVAVEQIAPHAVSVHRMTLGALDRGAKMARGWLEQFMECERTGVWPGYSDSVVDFDVPLEESDLVFADDDTDDSDEDQ